MVESQKSLLGDVIGHISRSNSKLGSVKSLSNKNQHDPKLATMKTMAAKADMHLNEDSKLSAPRLISDLQANDLESTKTVKASEQRIPEDTEIYSSDFIPESQLQRATDVKTAPEGISNSRTERH